MDTALKEKYACQYLIVIDCAVLTAKLESSGTEARTPIAAIRIAACQFSSVSAPPQFSTENRLCPHNPQIEPSARPEGGPVRKQRQCRDAKPAPPMTTPPGGHPPCPRDYGVA